jgi:hypothetical protein
MIIINKFHHKTLAINYLVQQKDWKQYLVQYN